MKLSIAFTTFLIFAAFSSDTYTQRVGSSARININNINLPFDKNGNISNVALPDSGTMNGYFGDHEFLFDTGFLLSGYSNDTLWANGNVIPTPYRNYESGIVGMTYNNTLASIYRLGSSDSAFGQSWQDWRHAVNLGADFYDGNHDSVYNPVDLNNNGVWDPDEDKPDIIGDESFWCVYNDGDPLFRQPLGIEVRQTIFGFAETGVLGCVVFVRYRFKNTGLRSDTLKDVYFSHFADADIGEILGMVHNYAGVDTIRNAVYTYMKTSSPSDWGDYPPCFLTDFLTGPISYLPGVTFDDVDGNNTYDPEIDLPIDTAICYRGPLGISAYPGAKNLNITSSIYSCDGNIVFALPQNENEVRNILFGLPVSGIIIDPCTWVFGEVVGGIPCNEVNPYFWCSGDPVLNRGWLSTVSGDVRTFQSTGPFNLVKDKEIEILLAFEVGKDMSPLRSVIIAKYISDEIQNFYENNFDYPLPFNDEDTLAVRPDYFLYQNYPNPFNPITKIGYRLQMDGFVNIEIFDILGKRVKTLLNKFQKADRYEVEFNGSGLASGIYIYRIKVNDFISSKKMVLLK